MARQNSRSTIFEDAFGPAKQAAYKILSFRDHTAFELSKKLSKKGFSEEIISEVITFLKGINLLNDLKFARNWSRFRIEHDNFGPIRLRQELIQKGLCLVDVDDLIDRLSKEYNQVNQVEQALSRRYKNFSSLHDLSQRRRAFDFLRRKGHRTENILAAFKKVGL